MITRRVPANFTIFVVLHMHTRRSLARNSCPDRQVYGLLKIDVSTFNDFAYTTLLDRVPVDGGHGTHGCHLWLEKIPTRLDTHDRMFSQPLPLSHFVSQTLFSTGSSTTSELKRNADSSHTNSSYKSYLPISTLGENTYTLHPLASPLRPHHHHREITPLPLPLPRLKCPPSTRILFQKHTPPLRNHRSPPRHEIEIPPRGHGMRAGVNDTLRVSGEGAAGRCDRVVVLYQ